jgi:hypothetical protein
MQVYFHHCATTGQHTGQHTRLMSGAGGMQQCGLGCVGCTATQEVQYCCRCMYRPPYLAQEVHGPQQGGEHDEEGVENLCDTSVNSDVTIQCEHR